MMAMNEAIRSQYQQLTPVNQSVVDRFIKLVFDEQSSTPNKDTLEAIREAKTGQTHKFNSVKDLMKWIDEEC